VVVGFILHPFKNEDRVAIAKLHMQNLSKYGGRICVSTYSNPWYHAIHDMGEIQILWQGHLMPNKLLKGTRKIVEIPIEKLK